MECQFNPWLGLTCKPCTSFIKKEGAILYCYVTSGHNYGMYCFSTYGHCCVLFCDFWMLRQAKSVRRVLTWSTSSLVDTPWSWWHSWSSWSASWCIPEMFKYAFIISPIYNKKYQKAILIWFQKSEIFKVLVHNKSDF